MSTKTKLIAVLALVGLLAIVVLYVLEFQWFNNYFGLKNLLIGAFAFALLLGIALGLVFQKRTRDLSEKIQIWATCIVVPFVMMPLLASLANRLFAEQPQPAQLEFWEEKAYVKNRYGQLKGVKAEASGYYIFVLKDGEMVRLESDHPMFPNAQQGDLVPIPIREGLFGASFAEW